MLFKRKNRSDNSPAEQDSKPQTTNLPVRDDNIPFSSDSEVQEFTNIIGDNYVSKRQMDLSDAELDTLSITDGSEMWRLYSWMHNNVIKDDTEEKRMLSRQRISRLADVLCKKILKADQIYCLYSKVTGEPYLFSRTVKQNEGYLCTPPDILIFTKAYVDTAKKHYPNEIFEMVKIENNDDEKGIENFLGKCFYINGAAGLEINSPYAAIDASKIVAPPNFEGVPEVSIPIMNPDLMRWMLLIAQMQTPESDDEKLIYKLYYRFMSAEITKARFIVPMRPDKNFPDVKNNNTAQKITLKEDAEFSIATIDGKHEKPAVLMYTDWQRLYENYSGWSGLIMTIKEIISVNDVAINVTKNPNLGFYIDEEIYNDMIRTAN